MDNSFRLLSFTTDDAPIEGDNSKINYEFLIKMFGINEKGETVALNVSGFKPYFYIKVDDTWKQGDKTGFIAQLKNDMGEVHANWIAVGCPNEYES